MRAVNKEHALKMSMMPVQIFAHRSTTIKPSVWFCHSFDGYHLASNSVVQTGDSTHHVILTRRNTYNVCFNIKTIYTWTKLTIPDIYMKFGVSTNARRAHILNSIKLITIAVIKISAAGYTAKYGMCYVHTCVNHSLIFLLMSINAAGKYPGLCHCNYNLSVSIQHVECNNMFD